MARLDLSVLVKVLGGTALKGLSGDLAKVDSQADKTQSKLAAAFNPRNLLLGGGIAVAGAQVLGFLNDSAAKASDLAEAQSKVNVVFGEGAEQVTKWAEGSAEGFLLSKSAALEAAGTYGNLFQAFGIGRESATEMSTTLVELAADMASFNNTSVDDALLALRSGLSGETEPLKRYGVALNEARLKQTALKLGIYDGIGALTAAQKAQASYTLILEDTTLAQGDVERTADGLANSQRRIAAGMDDFQAEVGQAWASIQLGAIKLVDSFSQLAAQTEEDFGKIGRVLTTDFLSFEGISDAVGTLVGDVDEKLSGMPSDAQIHALAAVRAVEAEYVKGQPVIATEAGKIAGMLPWEIQDRVDEVKTAAENMLGPDGLAGGILAAQNEPIEAIEELKRVMEESLSETEQIGLLAGEDTVRSLNEGLNSDVLVDRLTAHDAVAKIVEQLNTLGPAGAAAAAALLSSLNLGLQAPDPLAQIRQSSLRLAGIMTAPLMRSEPKDPRSPMRGMTHWGEDYIGILANDIEANLGTAASASRSLAATLIPSVGASDVPTGSVGTGGGGIHYHTHLTVQGDLKARNTEEAEDALLRVSRFSAVGGQD